MTIAKSVGLLAALSVLAPLPAQAQIGSRLQQQQEPGQLLQRQLPGQLEHSQSLVGQWQCVDGSRRVDDLEAGSHYHEFVIHLSANNTFQAQGLDHSGPFEYQAQGNWRLQQFSDGLFFVAEGQTTHPMLGLIQFKFMSVPLNAQQMAYSFQDQAGLAVASQCQRMG